MGFSLKPEAEIPVWEVATDPLYRASRPSLAPTSTGFWKKDGLSSAGWALPLGEGREWSSCRRV